jgi:hypothetical protein
MGLPFRPAPKGTHALGEERARLVLVAVNVAFALRGNFPWRRRSLATEPSSTARALAKDFSPRQSMPDGPRGRDVRL